MWYRRALSIVGWRLNRRVCSRSTSVPVFHYLQNTPQCSTSAVSASSVPISATQQIVTQINQTGQHGILQMSEHTEHDLQSVWKVLQSGGDVSESELVLVCTRTPQLLLHLAQFTTNFHVQHKLLTSYGLTNHDVLHIMSECPSVLERDNHLLYSVCQALQQQSIHSHSLCHVLRTEPDVLLMTAQDILTHCALMSDLFSRKQLAKLIDLCPSVFKMDMDELTAKYEYIHFHMGIMQHQLASNAHWLLLSLHEIECRHEFLRRTGTYTHPDPRNLDAALGNPLLSIICHPNSAVFAEKAAGVTESEWQAFMIMQHTKEDSLVDDHD